MDCGKDHNEPVYFGEGMDEVAREGGRTDRYQASRARRELRTAPKFNVDDVRITEGNKGASKVTFKVALSGPSDQTATVGYATRDGSATANNTSKKEGDYAPDNGTPTFASGETKGEITVSVTGERKKKGDETLLVVLSNPSNAAVEDGEGTGARSSTTTRRGGKGGVICQGGE